LKSLTRVISRIKVAGAEIKLKREKGGEEREEKEKKSVKKCDIRNNYKMRHGTLKSIYCSVEKK